MGPRAHESNVLDATDRRTRRTSGGFLLTILALVLGGSVALAQAEAQRALPTSSGRARPAATALAFTGVTVIDVTDGRRIPGQTVVIVGHRVQAVGPARAVQVPPGAQVVDARGKYLIPGLWDMHAHVDHRVEWYPTFIAFGVTGLREIAQRFYTPISPFADNQKVQLPFHDGRASGADTFRLWQSQVLAGTRVGPRVVGPSADVDGGEKPLAKKAEDLPRVVDSLKAAGMVFLKYHNIIADREYFFTLAREARRVGLPLVGHVSQQMSEMEAADSGLRSIEHVAERRCWAGLAAMEDSTPQTPADSVVREQPCALAAAAYRRNGTWLTPTFFGYYRYAMQQSVPVRKVAIVQRFIRTMRSFGVRTFLAGTDVVHPFVGEYNGLALLQEVVLLAHAGLTPLEALQAATLHPAQFFQATDSLGTVAPGKLADLVLLDADPLVDSRNVLKTRAVVANGRYFDRATLDTLAPPDAPQRIQAFLERLDATLGKQRGAPATAPSPGP